MPTRIITDSGSDIVGFDHPSLTVLPLTVMFGDRLYHDGADLTHEKFYELLVESDSLPSTGAPAPGAFAEAYDAARAAGEEVVVVTLSSKLSGTYQSACVAADGRDDVRVVDSLTASLGEQILVHLALTMAERGEGAASIAEGLREARGRVRVIGLLDTLEYLRRGGRIPAAAAALGAMLSVKPVVTAEDGEVVLLGKARGSRNGRNILNETVRRDGGIDYAMPFALGYSGLSDSLLRKYVEDSRGLWEGMVDGLPVCTLGATIGTYAGPGSIVLAYFKADGARVR
jgi:DegV family protein with EDD domain